MHLKWKSPEKYAKWIVLAFTLATPLFIYGAFLAVQAKTNKVEDWLPKTYSETDDLKWYREHFSGDQFVIVSWDGCRLGDDPNLHDGEKDDPRIERLAEYLMQDDPNLDPEDRNSRFFKSVTTGRRVLNQLTSGAMDLRYSQAVDRLRGALIGPDGHQTCVRITIQDEMVHDLRSAIGGGIDGWLQFFHREGALQRALRVCDIDPEKAYFGGPPVDVVAIDEEGEKSLYRLAVISALVGLFLAWWSLRSFSLTLIVFACGILSALASLAFVSLTGGTTDAFMLAMPSMIYVLAVSGAVHLIKYYRDAVPKWGLEKAPLHAIAEGWKPTLLCSVTTSIGLLALCTSDLTPIRKFGMYSSAGVMLMLIMLFVLLPAALYLWPVKKFLKGFQSTGSDQRGTRLDRFWLSLGGWITRHYTLVSVTCLAFIVGVGFGVTRTKTSVDIMKLFDQHARVRQDYQWLEKNLARLVPIEVILRFDKSSQKTHDQTPADLSRLTLVDRARAVVQIQNAIDSKFGSLGEDVIGRSMSPLTFIPPLPKRKTDFRSAVKESTLNTKLKQSYDRLLHSGYLARQSDGTELWRISVRVAAFKDVDYAEFSSRLRDIVDPMVQQNNEAIHSFGSMSVVYTGVIPIVYKAQNALLDSLMKSAFLSFMTITPLLIFVSRGFWSGLVAMLPNTLPVLVVFGGMGWLNISVTLGSMMSASIALGVAVDDTIHYLVWFRTELKKNPDRRQASLAAYRICATPTLQAALISGLGLAVFGFSNFMATKQFGLLMLVILVAGVVAELIMLPALLASPLGLAFEPKKKQGKVGKTKATEEISTEKPTEELQTDKPTHELETDSLSAPKQR